MISKPAECAIKSIPDECVHNLSVDEVCSFQNTLEVLRPYSEGDLDDPELHKEIRCVAADLPKEFRRKLIQFDEVGNAYGTLLIRGIPIDPELPPTPADGKPPSEKKTRYSEFSLLLTGAALGAKHAIAFADEKEGAIIQNICPIKGNERKQENTGSTTFLELHKEDGFHPYSPDLLCLFCLRADHDLACKTGTTSIRNPNVLNKMTWAIMEQLYKADYRLRLSSSFGNEELYTEPLAVLSGDPRSPVMNFDANGMVANNRNAQIALDELTLLLEAEATGEVLMPGDLLIIDNTIAAHFRTGFTPLYDGEERWLQRLFLKHDLRTSQLYRPPNSRVVVPLPLVFAYTR